MRQRTSSGFCGLGEAQEQLLSKGNTVLVAEHDPVVIKIADYIVDMGPQASSHGGQIVREGSYHDLLHADTLRGKYIGKSLGIKADPRHSSAFLETIRSSLHNLKDISLRAPKGIFTVITGVAGSGKSTLVSLWKRLVVSADVILEILIQGILGTYSFIRRKQNVEGKGV